MRLLRSIGALALAGAIGCGGGGDGGPAGPSGSGNPRGPVAAASVTMRGSDDVYGTRTFSFDPSSVTIVRGGPVTWTNGTSEMHNVTFGGSGAPADVSDHTGGSNTRRFDASGTFDYECTNHPGMTGRVTVQ